MSLIKGDISYRHRFYFPIFIFLILLLDISLSWHTYNDAKAEAERNLIARTDTIAQLVDEESVSSLSFNEDDLANPAYLDLKEKFINARNVNDDARFFYILGLQDGKVFFVVDSEPDDSEDYSPPGQEYEEAQAEIFEVFETGESLVQDVATDRWGTWVSGLSPIKDAEGKVKYLVGADIEASTFVLYPYAKALFPFSIFLILLVISIVVYAARKKEVEFLETKSQFISIASHELRAPITGIRWGAENLLKSKDISEEKKSIVKNIYASSMNLLSIVNDLLSVSLAEHDFVDRASFEKISLAPVLRDVAADLEAIAQADEIDVDMKLPSGSFTVKGNRARLKNVFSNIISNAIKYSNHGGRVTIAVDVNNDFVRVIVQDSGIGIPEKDLKKILQGFYRAENARKHTVQGTGLGLYICSRILDLHGGHLSVESHVGTGTKVTVNIPFSDK